MTIFSCVCPGDGLTATLLIRGWEQDNELAHTPVLALTAHAFEEDKQKSFIAGCDEHITKPVKKNSY